MLDTIRHRGPDDEGVHTAPGVGLGHCRLSIIDLSTGHQPLSNEDGTVWIVFNGEIYNFRELRAYLQLKGHVFRTKTDTEVIVHLYEQLGPACLDRLQGMFAFAIWDENTRTLFLARDRVGIKPLYYHCSAKALLFASEIKAILADPAVTREVAPEIVDRFLNFLYLPGEETLFKGVRKLPPGSYLLHRNGRSEVHQYWDLNFARADGVLPENEAEEKLIELLSASVESHMIADVPVGVLLSGGVDSTAVLSFAARDGMSAYTIGFSEPGLADERPYARLAAQACGVRHYEMTISAADFAAFLPGYVWHMEEPVCEPPAIALYYVSKLASGHVKVLLSGEGGDEAFAGYPNYRNLLWLERLKQSIGPLTGIPSFGLSVAAALFRMPRLARYAPLLNARFPHYYGSRTSSPYRSLENGFLKLYAPEYAKSIDREFTLAPLRRLQSNGSGRSVLNEMLYIDTKTWLPDDLLVKADKMTMANSVELRVPLLDHRILEFAASLPDNFKIRRFTTKYIAKRALSRYVPKEILSRKKVGFPVPYASWLRSELSSWLRDILLDNRTLARGYFDKSGIERLLLGHQQGRDCSKEVFSLAVLELWHRQFLDGARTWPPVTQPEFTRLAS